MGAEQEQLYYLVAPSRDSALASAYMEALKAKDLEVLLLYSTVDEFVMTNLMNYGGKSLVSAENAQLNLDKAEGAALDDADPAAVLDPQLRVRGFARLLRQKCLEPVAVVGRSG